MKLSIVAIVALAGIGSATTVRAQGAQDLSETLSYSKWSEDVNVPDPISITMDNEGRAYVTQTQRRKAQDLDIRNNRDWVANDVGLTSVEEKRAFFRSRISFETSDLNKARVDDYNEDGVHDYRDLMVLSEKIHLVEDVDGDGKADRIELYAEDFKTEVTGIAAGVLWDDGNVYSTVAPDVWKLRDTDGDGVADQREVMATGFGLHIAYGGHDMHGLIVGPDGKIYWSIGDKGINAVSQDGVRYYYPNQGGVMRCNPDGSDFEVFAHGLRNVQEIAFDDYGNWFGVDNDSDQKGEMERFVYIVENMDAGWRCNYQYRKEDYNPWMAEGLWEPHHEGQPAYIVPPIVNYKDGPAGFVRNPGTALNPKYKDYFFLNSTMNGSQWAFQAKENGASFTMENSHQIGAGIPLIGMTLGPDGALYSVDWGGGYPLNQRGAIWKIDDNTGAGSSAREEVAALLARDGGQVKSNELRKWMGHVDQRIRLKAQFELVKRGETKTLVAESKSGAQLKRIHAIWGLGQLTRVNDRVALKAILALLKDADPEIQVQSSKMLADLERGRFDGEALAPLMGSENSRVLFQAGIAIGNHQVSSAFDSVVSMIEANDGEDLYLRHAGVMALKGMGGAERLASHASEAVRIAAVVALRKSRSSKVAVFLKDVSPNVVREAVMAIHDDLSIPEAMPALAGLIDGIDSSDPAIAHRVINANLRLGKFENARSVAHLSARETAGPLARVEALNALGHWVDPEDLDRVEGRHRKLLRRSVSEIAKAVGPILGGLLASTDSAILEGAVSVADRLGVVLEAQALADLLRNSQASSVLRVLALESLDTEDAIDYGLDSGIVELQSVAAKLLVKRDPARATRFLTERLRQTESIVEKQGALASLSEIESAAADAIIEDWAQRLARGEVPAALQLDVIEAAAKRGFDESVAAFESQRKPGDPIAGFIESLDGGDPLLGEQVANTHMGAQCVRCHRFSSASGSKIGPSLKSIGHKDGEYLLRALVNPGADIAKGFGVVTVTLKDGSSVSGNEGKETADELQVLGLNGSAKLLDKADIASRTEPISSMPPLAYVLTKRELRDVVAYLKTLKAE